MKQHRQWKWILLIACCMVFIGALVACAPKVADTAAAPAADNSGQPAAPAASDNTTANPTAPAAGADSASQQDAIMDYLTNLPIPTPDYSSDQVLDPVAKMNSPESLVGSGVFPDNNYTTDILHTGARGCMSCHADLYSLVKNISPEMHVASPPTYGKPDDVKYCLTCHDSAGALTGPKFGDIIHAFHTNNDLFEDAYKGNCWSCHAVDYNGDMALWDTIKYDATMVGFPGANNDDVITWQIMRGFPTGHQTGFDMDPDFDLEIVSK